MNIFRAAFRHELISSARSRSPQLIVFIFLLLTSMSTFIGWLTIRNVTKIYTTIMSQGLTTAPNPFAGVPPMYYMRNSVIYIVLVGSLTSIVLGTQASLRDRKSSADVLIKTRNVNLLARSLGQLCAIGTIIAGLEIVVTASSFYGIWLILKHPLDTSSLIHLIAFGTISGIFMFAIACLSFGFGLFARSEETALLYPIITWGIITFAIPQVITSTHPVSLLNPTPAIATGTGLAQTWIDTLSPFMLMEHFKAICNSILAIDTSIRMSITNIASFSIFLVLAVGCTILVSTTAFGRKLNV